MVRPSRSLSARVHVPSPLSVPADRVVPVGTSLIVTSVISSVSSVNVGAMFRGVGSRN